MGPGGAGGSGVMGGMVPLGTALAAMVTSFAVTVPMMTRFQTSPFPTRFDEPEPQFPAEVNG